MLGGILRFNLRLIFRQPIPPISHLCWKNLFCNTLPHQGPNRQPEPHKQAPLHVALLQAQPVRAWENGVTLRLRIYLFCAMGYGKRNRFMLYTCLFIGFSLCQMLLTKSHNYWVCEAINTGFYEYPGITSILCLCTLTYILATQQWLFKNIVEFCMYRGRRHSCHTTTLFVRYAFLSYLLAYSP